MSTAGISFGGLASGLDTQAIISALLAVERRPIFALEDKQDSYKKQKSLFGDLDGLLDTLSSKANALKLNSTFLEMQASSSNEDIVTASASSTATPGTYKVTVDQLARGQINSAGYSSPDGPLSGSSSTVTLQLTYGDGSDVTFIDADNDLESIAEEINRSDDTLGTGVRAEVIDTNGSDPSTRYQLVVRSTEPGSDNAFSLVADSGGGDFDQLVTDLNANQTDALDALVTVNGVQITRSTNSITDLWGGITLNLLSAPTPTEEVTITVAANGEDTSAKIREFVDAYNAAIDFFEAQNVLDEEGQAQSELFGDTTLRSIRSSLRTIVGDSIDTGNEAYQLLSQIGITADTAGKLTFNQSDFEEALAEDETAVTELFTNASEGIASRLEDAIDLYTDSVDGLIKTRRDGFDSRIKQVSNRIEQAERRLELYEIRLTEKYANLETLLARLQGQGSSVGNINQAFG